MVSEEPAAVAVVIPAWRAAGTIGRALAGVAAQTRAPAEVVVVDDGSDDDTAAAAAAWRERLAARGAVLRVVRQPNRGAGAARNRGIAESAQPWIAFLDADDEWLPEKLERTLAHLEGTTRVLAAHDGWIVEPDGAAAVNACSRRFAEPRDPFVTLYRKGYIDTCTVLARRDALIAAGGFDETLPNAQDFEMWLALLREPGTGFVVFDAVLSRYHVTPGSIMSNTERRLACCLRVARRYRPALRRRPGSVLVSLWYRLAAIHYETMTTYRRRGDWGRALWTVARLPVALASETVRAALGGRVASRRFPAAIAGDAAIDSRGDGD